jgi:MSHA biogenesis protein MshQ
VEGVVNIRSGRARLSNAYGSEMLDLPVGFRTEFWNGTGAGAGWVLNAADSCTGDASLGAGNAVSLALVSAPGGLPTCVMESASPGLSGAGCATATVAKRFREGATPSVGFAGDFNLWLRAPGAGNAGSTTISATVPAWLGAVPPARAVFGIYKTPLIFRREVFR